MTSEIGRSTVSLKSTSTKGAETHRASKRKLKSGVKYAIVWIAYVLIGSWVFLLLEESRTKVVVEHKKWTRFKELVNIGEIVDELYELRKHLMILCPHPVFNDTFDVFDSGLVENSSLGKGFSKSENLTAEFLEEVEFVCKSNLFIVEEVFHTTEWSMVDAIYYTMTLVTTIGFGHISPTTDFGKLFCIPYALVGVPLTCILMAKTSEMLSNRMLKFYETTKRRYRRHPKILLGVVTWLFLIVGCFVFMFLPSLVFSALEEWSYIDAFYFTFITLTTIGFGDFIAAYGDAKQAHSDIYKIAIVVWIMIALGYWIFLLNFLQKAIKSNAKTLRKTFRTKTITKQADFLKQMISKMKQKEDDDVDVEDEFDERLHMMALIVESLSASRGDLRANRSSASLRGNRIGISRASICRSANPSTTPKVPQDRLQLLTKMAETMWKRPSHGLDSDAAASLQSCHIIEEVSDGSQQNAAEAKKYRKDSLINFNDLMNVEVSVKKEAVPGFKALMEQASNGETNSKNRLQVENNVLQKEVTLPLKDVLSVVLFVASIDTDVLKSNEDSLSEISASSSVGPVINPRESVPLLKSILVNPPNERAQNGINLHDKEHIQNGYFKSTLSSYLDDCDSQTAENELEPLSENEDENQSRNLIRRANVIV